MSRPGQSRHSRPRVVAPATELGTDCATLSARFGITVRAGPNCWTGRVRRAHCCRGITGRGDRRALRAGVQHAADQACRRTSPRDGRKRPALPTVEEPLRCRGRRGGNRRDGRGLLMRRKNLTVAVALAAASAVVLSACSSSSKGSGGGGTSANNNSNGVSGSRLANSESCRRIPRF